MFERKFKPNLIWLLIAAIVCLSIWQMNIGGPIVSNSHGNTSQSNSLSPVYIPNTLNSMYEYPTQFLSSNDYGSLMNYTSFKFQIVNNCSSSPFLLVLIHTSPKNFARRKSIRTTWGTKNDNIKIVFIVGNVSNHNVQKMLDAENKVHGDFVQGNFIDAYRNMTYKHVMAFKYAIYHCAQAKYVLKTDDDVFVNMPVMMDFLTALSPYGAKKLLLCNVIINSPVKRTFRSKWRVSFHEFSNKYYPPYCPGWAILYSPDILFELYKAIQKVNYFWIDDVLITGILAQNENIQHTDASSLILTKEYVDDLMKNSSRGGYVEDSKFFLFGPPDLPFKKMYFLWEFVKNHTSNKYISIKNLVKNFKEENVISADLEKGRLIKGEVTGQ